ncbi:hypothetical protein C8J30_102331 [Rhodobacter viridis]|uniref:Uncharacterized protein n=1 Tax=Rhodobacter viridis TaxID=1054202 RepID=A0A318U6K3_9RHOB|nr:hypothetical protein [Rhodobacter viridis]PYF12016.1 hypothetical protein C8J30_102331 [Rhodobacter viridis]
MTEQNPASGNNTPLHAINDADDAIRAARSLVLLIEMAVDSERTDENAAISAACIQAMNQMDKCCALLTDAASALKGGAQ